MNSHCVQVSSCQTTTGYLVKHHYYETLIQNFQEGLSKLMNEPYKHHYYAIDQYWKFLQRRDLWFIIVPLSVIQYPNYSNLANCETDYSNCMLDLNNL